MSLRLPETALPNNVQLVGLDLVAKFPVSLELAGQNLTARAVSDAGFGEFIRQLGYKADWYGSKVWAADRWYPSSKTCGDCGAINTGLTLRIGCGPASAA